jgi:hypothetical protein
MSLKNWFCSILVLGCLLPWTAAQASSVSALKNKRVIINMDTEVYHVGDVIYGMTGSKKTALIRIEKIKGNRALGVITRGHVAVGGRTMTRPSRPTRTARASEGSDDSYSRSNLLRKRRYGLGFLLSYATQSASMTVQSSSLSESAKFTGSAMGIKGFIDYDFNPNFSFRGALGLEPLQTKATLSNALCGNGTSNNCTFNYNFIALEAGVHYNLVTTPSRYWLGLGYSFLLDGGHSNNTPNVNLAGGTSQMILISGGADFSFGKRSYIPVAIEYGLFPSGGGVTINSIFLRAGYGMNF